MKIRRSPGIGKKLTAVALTAAILVCTVVQDGLNTADGNRRTAGLKDPEELERLYEELNADPEEVPGCRTESGRLAETLEERYAGIQEVLAQGNREERKDAAAGFRKEISGARESVEQEIDRIRQMDFMESPVLKERMEQWQQSMDEQFCELDENLKLIEQTGDEEAQEAIGRQLCSEKPEEALSDQPAVPNVRYAAETEDFTGMPKEAQEQGDALDFPEEELLAVPADLKEQFAANLETAELGSALEIYNYVKTQITFEAYYGARKGAEGTLAQKSGNDYDQAGLLVALLRANGIPAYYVRGEMLLSPEQAQEWTAAADAMAAVSQLAAQGIPVTALTAGGRIAAVRMERVWVKALVPYENYRGAGENNGEKVWIALDPAFKKSVWHTGTDISSLTGADELIDELEYMGEYTLAGDYGVSRVNYGELSEVLAGTNGLVQDYAQEHGLTDGKASELVGGKEIAEEPLGLLPSSLPCTVSEIKGEFCEIPEELTASISFSLGYALPYRFTAVPGGTPRTFSAPELQNKRITITWAPAAAEDEAVLEAYGGIFHAPSYLLRMKPQLRIDGELAAEWEAGTPGFGQTLEICVNAPGMEQETVQNTLTVGGIYGIILDFGRISAGELEGIRTRLDRVGNDLDASDIYEEAVMGELVNAAGKAYFTQLDLFTPVLAGQNGVNVNRTISVGIAAYQPDVRYLFFSPAEFGEGGLYLDIDLDGKSVVSNRSDLCDNEKVFLLQAGIFGSAMEHRVLEQMTGVESVSTVKLLQTANRQGIPICMVTPENADEVIGKLSVSEGVKANVRAAADRGSVVLLPQEAVRVYNWKGSGYLVLDPDSFSASYLIEGGLSGGSMSVKEAFSHYWKYVEEGLAGLVLMELFKYVLMAMSGNFYYLLLFELGFAAACIGYAGFLNLFQQFLETKDTSYLQEMEIRIAAMLTVGVIRLGPGKQAFDNLDAMAYERIYLSATGAGEQVCSAFLRSYGSANLPQAESAILSLRNQGFSDAQLLAVAEDFSVSLIPSVEGAFEQIGPMNAAEIDAALTLLKMAETTAAIEAMGTELSLIRQSGILLAELGNYGVWNPNGITALGNALNKGIQPETIAALCDKGIYPGRYEVLGIDSESKAQVVLGEEGSDVLKFNNWDDMKDAYKGTITQFVKENKPKYSPDIKKWFDNGGSIEIQNIDGKQIWTYTSSAGDSVPYIDGYIKFPDEYLNPTIKSVDIGEFSGDRGKDIDKMLSILEEDYGITEIPEGYIVHHDIENGILQLVDENIHTEFTHIGGHSIYK